MAAGRRTSKGADCRRRFFSSYAIFLRLYIYYRTCNVVYFTNEVQVYEYRAQYRESLRTCILAWHWDAVVKRNSVLCCEQKLRAQPSTHETQVQSDRQMRRAHSTVRAGGNKSKRARLRALVRRGCTVVNGRPCTSTSYCTRYLFYSCNSVSIIMAFLRSPRGIYLHPYARC